MKLLDVSSLGVGLGVASHAAMSQAWGWFSALLVVLSLHVYLLARRAKERHHP